MKYFYDCEFLEDGRIVDLISIGMVADDGREYYAVTAREDIIDLAFGHPWLSQHVVPSLPVTTDEAAFDWRWDTTHRDWPAVKPPKLIAAEVAAFILAQPDPQLWAWYGAYDHVALCQLWGRMIDLPAGVPMWTNDIRQEAQRLGNPKMPEQVGTEHNALDDARHNAAMWRFLAGTGQRDEGADARCGQCGCRLAAGWTYCPGHGPDDLAEIDTTEEEIDRQMAESEPVEVAGPAQTFATSKPTKRTWPPSGYLCRARGNVDCPGHPSKWMTCPSAATETGDDRG